MSEAAYLLLAVVVLFFVVVLWVFPGDPRRGSVALVDTSFPAPSRVASNPTVSRVLAPPKPISIPVAMSVAEPVSVPVAAPTPAGPGPVSGPPPADRDVPRAQPESAPPPPGILAGAPGRHPGTPDERLRRGLVIAAGAGLAIAIVVAARRA